MKELFAKISLTAVLLAALCSCESLTETQSPAQRHAEKTAWILGNATTKVRLIYNESSNQTSHHQGGPTSVVYPTPEIEVYGEPSKGAATKYHTLLLAYISNYCNRDLTKSWRDYEYSNDDSYSDGSYAIPSLEFSWRIIQDLLLRLDALGYNGKIDLLYSDNNFSRKKLHVSGCIPFPEMAEFTTPEVYEQQCNDLHAKLP